MTDIELLKYPIGKFHFPESTTKDEISSWMSVIKEYPYKLRNVIQNLDEESLNWIYRPEGWTIKQVVHHCADSHLNAFIRFKLALTEDNPMIKPYEEAKWAEMPDSLDATVMDSVHILEGIHNRWTIMLNKMSTSEFNRTFQHPEHKGTMALDKYLALYAWHSEHHLAHIQQAKKHQGKF